jgi:hypothetical protein
MKLHVSACIGHHQVSTMINMSLYNLYEGVLMTRSLGIKSLFALVSSVNCLYVTNREVFPISSMEIGIFVLGLHKQPSLAYRIRLLSIFGDPLCR